MKDQGQVKGAAADQAILEPAIQMMMSSISLGFVGALWAVIGYSLAFGAGGDWLGDTASAFLRGVGLDVEPRASNQPHLIYMCSSIR